MDVTLSEGLWRAMLRFTDLWERHKAGHLDFEEFRRRMAEGLHPGDPEAQARFLKQPATADPAVVDAVMATGNTPGLWGAIETARRLPGVPIPVGNPDDH
jgi:hypothetical protein